MATDEPIASCPSENALTEFLEGRLSAATRAVVHRHLDECTACRALLSDLAKAEIDSSGPTGRLEDDPTPPVPSPGPAPAATPALTMPGSRRFELIRRLGQGGMGVVYEAIDRTRSRRVACKTLRSMSAEALLRFKHEFRALQDVQHPNLVTLGDLVEENGLWWFTMELVEGVDFLSYARDETRLRAALAQLAAGLHALHGANKVHRDIKPQNVLVTAAGRVVILDFGLVGETEEVDSAVVGTAAYMAPEQASGGAIEPAADWFSVGVMLYEALTGQRPFEGTLLPALTNKARGEFAPPHTRRAGIPADLEALCVELLSPNPSLRPHGAALMRRLLSAPNSHKKAADHEAAESAPSSATSFVGRQPELLALQEAFSRSRAGQSILLLILGESGVGKSALLHEFVAQLQQDVVDAVVLSGRCYEREAVPYKAFDGIVDALSRYMKRLPKAEAAALLPRRAAALLQAFPVLGRVEVMREAPTGLVEAVDPKEQRHRVFTALRELLARLGERHPLVLTIDDLQWADADSIAMLGQLLHPPDAPALLLLATARPLEEARPVGFDAAVQRIGEVQKLALGPLPAHDARALAERLLGKTQSSALRLHPELAIDLAVESGGHPLFIDALIQHAESRGPDTTGVLRLDDAMAASIDRMDVEARHLLALVAVAGRPIGEKLLSAAAALDSDEYGRIERMLRAAHMIRGLPPADRPDSGVREIDVIESYHDRVRETMLARLRADELLSCHQRLANVLESSGQAEPEELALHFQGAGDGKTAARYTLLAAERAAKTLAFAHAARLYENALASSDLDAEKRHQAQVQLGEMLTAAGKPQEAARAFLVAAEGSEALAKLSHRQRAAELLLQNGAFAEGQGVLAEVLRALNLSLPVTGLGAFFRFIWLRLRLLLRGLRFEERAESDISPRELLRVDACWAAAVGHLLFEPLRAMALHSQHLLLSLELGEPMRTARALALEAVLRNFLGSRQYRRADELIAESRRLGRQLGSPYVLGFSNMTAGIMAFHRGRLRTSIELAQEGESIFKEHCPAAAWEIRNCQGIITMNLGMMGRYKELAAVLPDFVQGAHDRGDSGTENSGQIWQCIVYLAHDELERARALTIEMKALVSRTRSPAHEGNVLHADAMQTFYTEPELALSRFYADWLSSLRRSSLRTSPLTRGWALYIEASARFFANEPALSPSRIRRIAKKIAKEKEAMPVAQSLALRAALAHRLGDNEEAARLAALAEHTLKTAEYFMHAAVARYRQGQYLGEEAGRALRDSAIASMSAEGIKSPEKFARILMP